MEIPPGRLLLRAVCILLECILVKWCKNGDIDGTCKQGLSCSMIPKLVSNEGWFSIKGDGKSEFPLYMCESREFIALDSAGTTDLHE